MIVENSSKEITFKKWKELKEKDSKLRIRDCANLLDVSEAELLLSIPKNSEPEFPSVFYLNGNWESLLLGVQTLGRVMALTRNESCVHERKGEYKNVNVNGQMALVVGEEIDLRIFLSQWKFGFAVEEIKKDETLRSFQIFDLFGNAVHKIYLRDPSKIQEWETLKNSLCNFEEHKLEIQKEKKSIAEKREPINKEDKIKFLQSWGHLKDTHEFFSLLKNFKITRPESMRIAEGKFTTTLSKESVWKTLNLASENKVPIMVFVGNPGCIQIHTGEIFRTAAMGPWWNVLDPEFNLHLNSETIKEVWKVVKPSQDGDIHSIEVYDSEGELIVQFFGKRKPGIPEREDWRDLLSNLS
ncbi:hemin-degrading factor [Leptospira sp. WS92.C1]